MNWCEIMTASDTGFGTKESVNKICMTVNQEICVWIY